MTALAHTHDPDTSHEAVARLDKGKLDDVKWAILFMLKDGPATVTELTDWYFEMREFMKWPLIQPHSIARRCTDLKNRDLIADTGERRPTKYGKPSAVLRRVA